MGGRFGIYNGKKVRPVLEKVAKEHNKSYEEVKKVFIKQIAEPDTISIKKKIAEWRP